MELTLSRRLQFLQQFVSYTFLILLSVVMSFPLFWIIMTSVKQQREVFTSFLPRQIDFSNFERVWNAMDLPTHLGNSLYVAGVNVAIVVVTATIAGYAFARFEFPGRDWIFYVFLAAMMIPGQAILINLSSSGPTLLTGKMAPCRT